MHTRHAPLTTSTVVRCSCQHRRHTSATETETKNLMMDDNVFEFLVPMFPQLTHDVIKDSVHHLSNRHEPLDEGHLLQRCIDDLLQLRTFSDRTIESLHEGPTDNDIMTIESQPLWSPQEHGLPDVLLITDSPKWEYTCMSSPQSSSMAEVYSDQRQTFNTSPIVTPKCVSSQGLPMLTVGSKRNNKRNQGTANLHDYDVNLPNISSPMPKRRMSSLSSTVTHNAPQTSFMLPAATHETPPLTCGTISFTPNASARHSTGAVTHKASVLSTRDRTSNILLGAPSNTTDVTNWRVPMTSVHKITVSLALHGKTNVKSVPSTTVGMADVTIPLPSTSNGMFRNVFSSEKQPPAKVQEAVPASQTTASIPGTVPPTVPFTSQTAITISAKVPSTSQTTVPMPGAAPSTVPPISQQQPKSREERLEEQTQEVCCVFTDADRGYVKDLLRHTFYPDPVNTICNNMLEENNYPRTKKPEPIPLPPPPSATPSSTAESPVTRTPEVNYYDDTLVMSELYKSICIMQLQFEFRKIANRSILQVARHFGQHYTPTRRALMEAMQHFTQDSDVTMVKLIDSTGLCAMVRVARLKGNRKYRIPVDISTCPELQDEVLHEKQEEGREQNMEGMQTNNEPGIDVFVSEDFLLEDTNATIECGCCYGDCRFEDMVQCCDGHLFCRTCVERYTRESVFGQGKANLVCMTDSCEATFPRSQLEVALPPELLSQFESRMQEEAINSAGMEDLVRCPHCDFAAILDAGDKVFSCVRCFKETCRYCKENWNEHMGIPCKELEKKDETKIRLAFEEKMTEAKIRVCHRCKACFTKLDGCNKMTCRCGAKMCYICRKPDIDYNHFCQHVRNPGQQCDKCKDCSLWTNPDEDEEHAISELKKEAQFTRKEQGYTDEKLIGASNTPGKKK